MIKAIRRHMTYANVTATLALFIALGGTSYAALTITGKDVQKRTLTGKHLKRNTITGTEIRERTLGVVPRARNAARLGGVPARRYLVRCPAGLMPVSNVCVETEARPPAPYSSAAVICELTDRRARPGRRLPRHDELMTALGDYGITLAPGGELTSNVYPSATSGRPLDVLYITDPTGNTALTPDTDAGAKSFRCVADPVN